MKIVLIHGKDTNPFEKWYPWFVEKVRDQNLEIIVPKLPDSSNPLLEDWLKEINKTNPDKNTVLIGHSRGGMAILRWLERLPPSKGVQKVILIATNNPSVNEKNQEKTTRGFYECGDYDFEKIKTHCEQFVVIHSKDDSWVPFEAGELNAKGLNAKFILFEDKNHFGKNIKEFPELLDEILK